MSELVRDWKAEKRDLEEAFVIIADKQIERLKGLILALGESKVLNIERLEAENNSLRLDAVENRRLITSLCDALVVEHRGDDWEGDVDSLIQRAREATR